MGPASGERMTSCRSLAAAVLVCFVGACGSVGPGTVQRDRVEYGDAIAESWKQQTLLNIVKVRYGDFPVFLEVAQVVAGYQIQSTGGVGFSASNASAGTIGQFVAGGNLAAAATYTDRPTLVYSPLTGTDFVKHLMTPIPPAALLFLLQSGYPADYVLGVAVNSMNGVSNESRRGMSRAANPQFTRLADLLRQLQLADGIQVRIVPGKGNADSTLLVFPQTADAAKAANAAEVFKILQLNPKLRAFTVAYGGATGKDSDIGMNTRSMMQIMQELGSAVQVPATDITSGRATQGAVSGQAGETGGPLQVTIATGDAAPPAAYVAVRYHDRWFWIDETDIRSKLTFGFVMLLFAISDTGQKAAAPTLTVPASP